MCCPRLCHQLVPWLTVQLNNNRLHLDRGEEGSSESKGHKFTLYMGEKETDLAS